jgi:hypothetical protein
MSRFVLTSFAVLSLFAVSFLAVDAQTGKDSQDKTTKEGKGEGKGKKATITKVDPKAGTITVKMKDKENKEVEKTFKLTEEIRYFDSTGKAVAIDAFQSGHDILIVEAEGKLKEIRKQKSDKKSDKKSDTK